MSNYCAIYDFDLMPYALGDVLTWNVQTAIRCEEAEREAVDVHICLDQRHPSSIYQSDMINADNCWMFFNELFGAFGTHPRLGNIVIHRSREDALQRLRAEASADPVNIEPLADYEHALANRYDNDELIAYFTKYIYYHKGINAFAARHGRIPLLQPSLGCEPDVEGLMANHLVGRRIVLVHMRQRRLDAGYGGAHTHTRDSDFLEWYDFLREAEQRYPDVLFVVLGRLQEKPLELLRLPNVTSLRTLGFGLGHELTLMLRGDLFIGTSSGFAALANFSELPYFITRMGRESCNAYEIEFGCDRLPFATERQRLIYEPETKALLLRLLEQGLAGVPPRGPGGKPTLDPAIDVRSWEWERAQWLHPGATSARYFLDETYRDKETAFLVWPKLKAVRAPWYKGWRTASAWEELKRLETHFPRMCANFPEFLRLRGMLAVEHKEWSVVRACQANLERLAHGDKAQARAARIIRRYLVWGMPSMVNISTARFKAYMVRFWLRFVELLLPYRAIRVIKARLLETQEAVNHLRAENSVQVGRNQMLKAELHRSYNDITIHKPRSIIQARLSLEVERGVNWAEELDGLLNWPEIRNPVERTSGMPELMEMIQLCGEGEGPVSAPSAAWQVLGFKNFSQLLRDGYSNFKRTIGCSYFNFLVQGGDPQIAFLETALDETEMERCAKTAAALHDDPGFAWHDQRAYRYFVLMLWAYASKMDVKGYLSRIEEPEEGNPLTVQVGKHRASQDLANSVLEYYSMAEHVDFAKCKLVLEIGGGYGRDAFVVMKLNPHIQYTLVDIPPALWIAQRYLSSVFPERKVFHVRDFKNYDEVAEEMERASIVFLLPHQLELLPDRRFDLGLNISSFGEMQPEQIETYLNVLERVTQGHFYMKQWKVSQNAFDHLALTEDNYPISRKWKKLYSRTCAVQTAFFEALYRTE